MTGLAAQLAAKDARITQLAREPSDYHTMIDVSPGRSL